MKTWHAALAFLMGLLSSGCSFVESPADPVVLLDGSWELDGVGKVDVPGHVLLALEANGSVPNAFLGTNEGDVQWVEDSVWTYRYRFQKPEHWAVEALTFLEFDGLDTYATVWLDGSVVLESDNAHRTWRTAAFAAGAGEHELVVQFLPVGQRGMERMQAAGGPLPASNEPRPIGQQSSPFTRKSGYEWGWDWGPRLAGPGITGSVRWVQPEAGGWTDAPTPWCEVLEVSPRVARVRVHGREGWTCAADGRFHWEGDTMVWPAPELWWPKNMGTATLHPLTWTHAVTGAQRHEQLGLRTVRWVQTPDTFGTSFALEVNGIPVQAKGANLVPPDYFVVRAREGWEGLVQQAVAAEMNMLRVWGGQGYLPEAFYAACDRAGLLVWQDFAFACAMVPGDASFRANVQEEALQQVRRLRHHPCLALWCGNNEIEKAWNSWGWQDLYGLHGDDSVRVWRDYETLFHALLPEVVAAECDVQYWPSSPFGDERSGDEHAWGVWFGLEDFSYYSQHGGRFASEYGLQSLPDRHTLRQAGIEAFGDSALQYRQRSRMDWLEPGFDGWDMMQHFMGKTVGHPTEGDLDEWIFLSQTTQALGLQHALERHRTSAGRVSGSLYWSLNDVWPAVSWSTIDWAGRWKLGHYAVRRANAPRTIQWQRERSDSLVLVAFNDGPVEWRDSIQLDLKTPDGQVRRSARREFSVPAHGSAVLSFGPMAKWQADPGHTYLAWEVADKRTSVLWDMPVDFHRPPGHVEARATPRGLELQASFYEPVVGLTANVPGHFLDNGFALEAGELLQVEFVPEDVAPTIYTVRTLGHPEGIMVIRNGVMD